MNHMKSILFATILILMACGTTTETNTENLAESKRVLEENGKKDGVITTESGLQYKILTKGTGLQPLGSDRVVVNYVGTLFNDAYVKNDTIVEFDSGSNVTFSPTSLIKGWQEALFLMNEGAKWELFLPPSLAYGEFGTTGIPGNSAIRFEVELLEVKR